MNSLSYSSHTIFLFHWTDHDDEKEDVKEAKTAPKHKEVEKSKSSGNLPYPSINIISICDCSHCWLKYFN